jgi:hypothetical protein
LDAEVAVRRRGGLRYSAKVYDLSSHGCKIEFPLPLTFNDIVWLRFDGLEPLESAVCWVDGLDVGVEFQKRIHAAVLEVLVRRISSF